MLGDVAQSDRAFEEALVVGYPVGTQSVKQRGGKLAERSENPSAAYGNAAGWRKDVGLNPTISFKLITNKDAKGE